MSGDYHVVSYVSSPGRLDALALLRRKAAEKPTIADLDGDWFSVDGVAVLWLSGGFAYWRPSSRS
jgi:hypothetical protein